MKRLFVAGLVLVGATAVAIGSVRAAEDPPADVKTRTVGRNFVDADGDGVCDKCMGSSQGKGRGQGGQTARQGRQGQRGRGPGDGSGNQGVGPRDGLGRGQGPGAHCDGSGPKGGHGGRGGRRGGGRR